jgi:hypothetical protein
MNSGGLVLHRLFLYLMVIVAIFSPSFAAKVVNDNSTQYRKNEDEKQIVEDTIKKFNIKFWHDLFFCCLVLTVVCFSFDVPLSKLFKEGLPFFLVFVAVSFDVSFKYWTDLGPGYAGEVAAKFKELLVVVSFLYAIFFQYTIIEKLKGFISVLAD